MKCKKCNGSKLIVVKKEVFTYTNEIEYLCTECKTTSYKTVSNVNALYTTEKFNF